MRAIDIDDEDTELRIRAIPFERFKTELLDEEEGPYAPGLVAKQTRRGMVAAMKLIGELTREAEDGRTVPVVATTADLNTKMIVRIIKGRPAGESPHSTRTLLRLISAACTVAVRSGYLRVNPFTIKRVGAWVAFVPPSGKRHLSKDEVRTLLDRARGETEDGRSGWKAWKARRLFGMFATSAFAGLRTGELVNLHLEDVDLPNRILRIHPHGRRLKTTRSAQPVPIAEPLAPILAEWLRWRLAPPTMPPADKVPWLWPGCEGIGPWNGGPPGHTPLGQLRELGNRAEIEGVTWQVLRRSLAVHLEAHGVGSAMIARILRHSEQTDATWYRAADEANIRSAVAGFNFDFD